jgi:hypothetical protein
VRLEGDGLAPIEVFSSFPFTLTAQDLEDLRWYLEEYAEFPYDPAPTIAARVEHRIAEIGNALFDAVFRSSDDARDLWAILRADLSDTRIEVAAEVGSPGIPWELLRDPATDVPLALRARAFVRTLPTPAQRPRLPGLTDGAVRILLVISRPGGGDDVPFRSVASRLIAALGTSTDRYQLDVLRPATFARLSQVLRQAHLRGEPYHVVHFDGHGAYLSYRPQAGAAPLVYGTPRPGSHGYLAFEDPTNPDGVEMVDGPTLGALLAETQVPVLVLNACRSAHAEPLAEPSPAPEEGDPADPHAQVRAYGSLAQEVMDAGVAGVVAMRYNVYVVTAAQFVADLYSALRQGQPLGEGVSLGRKQLDANPVREFAGERVDLQDWPVPVVYEAAPLQLFPLVDRARGLDVPAKHYALKVLDADEAPEPLRRRSEQEDSPNGGASGEVAAARAAAKSGAPTTPWPASARSASGGQARPRRGGRGPGPTVPPSSQQASSSVSSASTRSSGRCGRSCLRARATLGGNCGTRGRRPSSTRAPPWPHGPLARSRGSSPPRPGCPRSIQTRTPAASSASATDRVRSRSALA